jgi:hypothetical protein
VGDRQCGFVVRVVVFVTGARASGCGSLWGCLEIGCG